MGRPILKFLSVEQRPTAEATRMLKSISSESVRKVLAALAGSIKDMTAQGAKKTTESLVNKAGAAVQGVADVGRTVGESTLGAYVTTKEGVKKATGTIVNATGVAVQGMADAGRSIGDYSHDAYRTSKSGAKKIAARAGGAIQKTKSGMKNSVKKAGSLFSRKNT